MKNNQEEVEELGQADERLRDENKRLTNLNRALPYVDSGAGWGDQPDQIQPQAHGGRGNGKV
jgi:hypothetical protein